MISSWWRPASVSFLRVQFSHGSLECSQRILGRVERRSGREESRRSSRRQDMRRWRILRRRQVTRYQRWSSTEHGRRNTGVNDRS